jgi:hypothetical protein
MFVSKTAELCSAGGRGRPPYMILDWTAEAAVPTRSQSGGLLPALGLNFNVDVD